MPRKQPSGFIRFLDRLVNLIFQPIPKGEKKAEPENNAWKSFSVKEDSGTKVRANVVRSSSNTRIRSHNSANSKKSTAVRGSAEPSEKKRGSETVDFLNQIYCPSCYKAVPNTSQFCPHCKVSIYDGRTKLKPRKG